MTPEFFTQQLWRAAQQRKECKVKLKGEIFPRTIHPYGIGQSSRNTHTPAIILSLERVNLGFIICPLFWWKGFPKSNLLHKPWQGFDILF